MFVSLFLILDCLCACLLELLICYFSVCNCYLQFKIVGRSICALLHYVCSFSCMLACIIMHQCAEYQGIQYVVVGSSCHRLMCVCLFWPFALAMAYYVFALFFLLYTCVPACFLMCLPACMLADLLFFSLQLLA